MANMFEKAVESYNGALEIDSLYLDAISSRGSSRIILGKYQEAAQDFMTVMKNDTKKRYQDVYTGLARVLQARESAVPEGWTPMIQNLEEMIPLLESQADLMEHPEGKTMLANTLNRFYQYVTLFVAIAISTLQNSDSFLLIHFFVAVSCFCITTSRPRIQMRHGKISNDPIFIK